MTRIILRTFCALALFSLVACGKEKVVFEKDYPITNARWTYGDTLNFAFTIADTTTLYDLALTVKHSPNYATQNVYTNIYTLFPQGQRIKQLLNIDLADNTGKWEGKCGSTTCDFEVKIQENAFFNQAGNYTITLEQYMRTDSLSGIQNIGLKVIDKGEKRTVK